MNLTENASVWVNSPMAAAFAIATAEGGKETHIDEEAPHDLRPGCIGGRGRRRFRHGVRGQPVQATQSPSTQDPIHITLDFHWQVFPVRRGSSMYVADWEFSPLPLHFLISTLLL